MTRPRAIDSLINSSFIDHARSQTRNGAANNNQRDGGLRYLFKDLASRPPIHTPEELLAELDANNIGACVVSIMGPDHTDWDAEAHAKYPRKILPAMIVNPLNGMDEVRKVVHYVENYGVRCLRIPPFRYTLPPTDRVYWPFYVKAIELNLAISMNAGMPGPRRPGCVQNPIHYDEVAFHFPELRLVMTHCGQPWTEEVISTITHWDNVYMSCTAVAPKYWPNNFVHFIYTRGKAKLMFGTEYPTIDWDRSRSELDSLELRESVTADFYAGNAKRAFDWNADVS